MWFSARFGLSAATVLAAMAVAPPLVPAQESAPPPVVAPPAQEAASSTTVVIEGGAGGQAGSDSSGESERKAATTAVPAYADSVQLVVEDDGVDERGHSQIRVRYLTREEAAPTSRFWIGVRCEAATETLRSQLRLPADQGVVVLETMPESPARAAGLQAHDVILGLCESGKPEELVVGKAIGEPEILVKLVEENGVSSKPLGLAVVSAGTRKRVLVTPVERPAGEHRDLGNNTTRSPLGLAYSTVPPQPAEARPTDVTNIKEGLVVRNGDVTLIAPRAVMTGTFPYVPLPTVPELPEDVEITITRAKGKPARVSVKAGDQSWTTTEDRLDALPDNVRPVVSRWLGKDQAGAVGFIRTLPALPQPLEARPGPYGKPGSFPAPSLQVPPGSEMERAVRQKAEAIAREELSRAKDREARIRQETEKVRQAQMEAERLIRESQRQALASIQKQQEKEERIRKEASDRLERVEKSLAELIELQKSLVKSLAEKEQRGGGADARKE